MPSCIDIARKNVGRLAAALTKHFVRHLGRGFGRSTSPADMATAFEAARPLSSDLVSTLFAQEMETHLRAFVESGQAAKVASSKRG